MDKSDMRKFGPRSAEVDWPQKDCPACREPFAVGDYTTLIPLGPGKNEQERKDCREGRFYAAVAIEVHWACATGEES